ncbi:MAG: hypothetical protein HWN79_15445, partial [Candidatus Lokiarchaeota archaeon]|nr:hypothetical protein [Candidatus Lokiarchaeota archaeon]
MEKKNLAITVLIVALLGSGIANILLVVLQPDIKPSEPETIYVRATSSGPDTLELVDAWDSASNDVLEQVVETLFFYELTDLDLPRINLLAYSYFWEDVTTLH